MVLIFIFFYLLQYSLWRWSAWWCCCWRCNWGCGWSSRTCGWRWNWSRGSNCSWCGEGTVSKIKFIICSTETETWEAYRFETSKCKWRGMVLGKIDWSSSEYFCASIIYACNLVRLRQVCSDLQSGMSVLWIRPFNPLLVCYCSFSAMLQAFRLMFLNSKII